MHYQPIIVTLTNITIVEKDRLVFITSFQGEHIFCFGVDTFQEDIGVK